MACSWDRKAQAEQGDIQEGNLWTGTGLLPDADTGSAGIP